MPEPTFKDSVVSVLLDIPECTFNKHMPDKTLRAGAGLAGGNTVWETKALLNPAAAAAGATQSYPSTGTDRISGKAPLPHWLS